MHFHVGSFGRGVLFSVILLYIGTIYHIEILRSSIFQPTSSTKDSLDNVVSESSANETLDVTADQKFPIEDHVENSTFGV